MFAPRTQSFSAKLFLPGEREGKGGDAITCVACMVRRKGGCVFNFLPSSGMGYGAQSPKKEKKRKKLIIIQIRDPATANFFLTSSISSPRPPRDRGEGEGGKKGRTLASEKKKARAANLPISLSSSSCRAGKRGKRGVRKNKVFRMDLPFSLSILTLHHIVEEMGQLEDM